MITPIPEEKGFAGAIIDALSSHICVIDEDSIIVAVNRAWRHFAIANPPVLGGVGVGTDYLKVCRNASGPGSEGAKKFAVGVKWVLEGKTELFEMEYPCHSPTENRWFMGSVTPLKSSRRGAVISHITITDRKLLELELAKLAATDSLTGLPNRRHFMKTAKMEVERVSRFGSAAAVVMIDIDRFKDVNDTYGHTVGDEALRCFAQACKKPLRQIDILARMGGEEFAVILPGTNETGAVKVAEKLRSAVAEAPVGSGRNKFNITASFGVAEVRATDRGMDECLGRADAALYAAKGAGRNRVIGFSTLPREAQKLSA